MEKPLHVRVAEALGWTDCKFHAPRPGTIYADGHWRGRHPEGSVAEVPFYDTDWSTTGPLLERLGISLNYFVCDPDCCHPDGVRWTAAYGSLGLEFAEDSIERKSPLLAVCSLILSLHDAGKLLQPSPHQPNICE